MGKKNFTLSLICIATLMLSAQRAWADWRVIISVDAVTLTDGNFRLNVEPLYDENLAITGCTALGTSTELDLSGTEALKSNGYVVCVEEIRASAFTECTGLTSIVIPSTVEKIDVNALRPCTALTSIKVANGNSTYDSRNNCNAIIKTSTNTLLKGCNTTVVPGNVAKIGDSAFAGTGITSISLPDSVTTVGDKAFADCTSLESAAFHYTVTSIGANVFDGCTNLKRVVVQRDFNSFISNLSGITELKGALGGGDNTVVYVPLSCLDTYKAADNWKDVKNMQGAYTFTKDPLGVGRGEGYVLIGGLVDLFYVWNPSGTKLSISAERINTHGEEEDEATKRNNMNVGGNVFKGDLDLSRPIFGADGTAYQLTCIGDNAFSHEDVTSVEFPSTLETIGNGAFSYTKITSVTIPESVTKVAGSAFNGCESLASADWQSKYTVIKSSTFANCSALKSFKIPEWITEIGALAFTCTGLTSIDIPAGVTEIGLYALSYCPSLSQVNFKGIPYVDTYAFDESPMTNVTLALSDNSYVCTSSNTGFPKLTVAPTYTRSLLLAGDEYNGTNVTEDQHWGSMMLPFAVKNTAKVKMYKLCAASDDALTFKQYADTDVLPANTPVTIYAHGGEREITFTGTDTNLSVESDGEAATDVSGWTMKGSYEEDIINSTAATDMYYFGADNTLYYADEDVTVIPFRGWFEAANGTSAKRAFKFFIIEDPAGIEEIENGELKVGNSAVYGINGQRLNAAQNGINIINGKKYMVK